eukprot:5118774-Ditylum_brightwellii.AAC.1
MPMACHDDAYGMAGMRGEGWNVNSAPSVHTLLSLQKRTFLMKSSFATDVRAGGRRVTLKMGDSSSKADTLLSTLHQHYVTVSSIEAAVIWKQGEIIPTLVKRVMEKLLAFYFH